jgi:hypothetical protein
MGVGGRGFGEGGNRILVEYIGSQLLTQAREIQHCSATGLKQEVRPKNFTTFTTVFG